MIFYANHRESFSSLSSVCTYSLAGPAEVCLSEVSHCSWRARKPGGTIPLSYYHPLVLLVSEQEASRWVLHKALIARWMHMGRFKGPFLYRHRVAIIVITICCLYHSGGAMCCRFRHLHIPRFVVHGYRRYLSVLSRSFNVAGNKNGYPRAIILLLPTLNPGYGRLRNNIESARDWVFWLFVESKTAFLIHCYVVRNRTKKSSDCASFNSISVFDV